MKKFDLKNLVLTCITKAGYADGIVRAETMDYKDNPTSIVNEADTIKYFGGSRDGNEIEWFQTETEFGFALASEALMHGIDSVHVQGSNVCYEFNAYITLGNSVLYTLKGQRIYAD